MSIENAQIIGTFLGIEEHDILTAFVQTKRGQVMQSFGGYRFDCRNSEDDWIPSCLLAVFVRGVIDAVGAPEWGKLNGSYCRVRIADGGGRIIAIGHLTENHWFDPEATRWWRKV